MRDAVACYIMIDARGLYFCEAEQRNSCPDVDDKIYLGKHGNRDFDRRSYQPPRLT